MKSTLYSTKSIRYFTYSPGTPRRSLRLKNREILQTEDDTPLTPSTLRNSIVATGSSRNTPKKTPRKVKKEGEGNLLKTLLTNKIEKEKLNETETNSKTTKSANPKNPKSKKNKEIQKVKINKVVSNKTLLSMPTRSVKPLTVPKEFNFQTSKISKRTGEKLVKTPKAKKTKVKKAKSSITVAEPFNLQTTMRVKPSEKKDDYVPLAVEVSKVFDETPDRFKKTKNPTKVIKGTFK
jgi:hypothetical protein